jgi:hypothetical protein
MPKTDAISFSREKLLRVGITRPLACGLPAACLFTVVRTVPSLPAQIALALAAEAILVATLWRFNFEPHERRELSETICQFLKLRSLPD